MKRTAKKPASVKQLLPYLQAHPYMRITFPEGFQVPTGRYKFDGFIDGDLCFIGVSGVGFRVGFSAIRCENPHCPIRYHEISLEWREDGFLLEFADMLVSYEYVE